LIEGVAFGETGDVESKQTSVIKDHVKGWTERRQYTNNTSCLLRAYKKGNFYKMVDIIFTLKQL
jgi:uncharacterized protein